LFTLKPSRRRHRNFKFRRCLDSREYPETCEFWKVGSFPKRIHQQQQQQQQQQSTMTSHNNNNNNNNDSIDSDSIQSWEQQDDTTESDIQGELDGVQQHVEPTPVDDSDNNSDERHPLSWNQKIKDDTFTA
jgi:hypothetical protein